VPATLTTVGPRPLGVFILLFCFLLAENKLGCWGQKAFALSSKHLVNVPAFAPIEFLSGRPIHNGDPDQGEMKFARFNISR